MYCIFVNNNFVITCDSNKTFVLFATYFGVDLVISYSSYKKKPMKES